MILQRPSISAQSLKIFLGVILLHCLIIGFTLYHRIPPSLESSGETTITVSLISKQINHSVSQPKTDSLPLKKVTPTHPIKQKRVAQTDQPSTLQAAPQTSSEAQPAIQSDSLNKTLNSTPVAAKGGALQCKMVKPAYPNLSRRRGETGTAYVSFVISKTGQLNQIKLQKSSGFSMLDQAAISALQISKCQPYLENGQVVEATYTQPFSFGLSEDD